MQTAKITSALRVGLTALTVLLVARVLAVCIDAFAGPDDVPEWILASTLVSVSPPVLQFVAALVLQCTRARVPSRLDGVSGALLVLTAAATAAIAIGSLFQGWSDSLGTDDLTIRADAVMQIGFAAATLYVSFTAWKLEPVVRADGGGFRGSAHH